jgi:cellulose synthase/poly-beta-1,6-N-acetylglucosamine synthase-like glycosyltransferase
MSPDEIDSFKGGETFGWVPPPTPAVSVVGHHGENVVTAVTLPVGKLLVERGLITQSQLDEALAAQTREGSSIGLHLILGGHITRRQLYSTLAEQWNAPLVDLVATPIGPGLLVGTSAEVALARGWVPWRREGNTLLVAVRVPPTEQLRADVLAVHGDDGITHEVEFSTTTDWDMYQAVMAACRDALLYTAASQFSVENPDASAKAGLTGFQRALLTTIGLILLLGLITDTRPAVVGLLIVANVTFSANIVFKVGAGIRGKWRQSRRKSWDRLVAHERHVRGLPVVAQRRKADQELPIYTILIPAFREENIVAKLIDNIGSLDYPKSKLDVLVLLEEDDTETLEAIRRAQPPEYVRILVVGAGHPQTKPRACNYGLEFARGQYVVIFDAEDRPDPGQLRAAVAEFEFSEWQQQIDPSRRTLVCVQAGLNYFNADYNVLTRMFALEYSFWFDAMLPGMVGTSIPLPLGGTSNHFRARELRELGAWDPYNVTEDADLGLRAAVSGYEVGTVDSVTWEEACSETGAWIKQRTRWIKGYMITSAVNLRSPLRYTKATGLGGVVGLFGLILGTPIAFLLYPLVLGFTVITYVGVGGNQLRLPEWLLYAGAFNMIVGNIAMIVMTFIAAERRHGWRMACFAVFNPIYWVLHAWAAWRALYQLIRNPHMWEKTPHGLTGEHETETYEQALPRKRSRRVVTAAATTTTEICERLATDEDDDLGDPLSSSPGHVH